jgi:hypothetical protein
VTGGCAGSCGCWFGVFGAGEETVFAGRFFPDGLWGGFTTTKERHDCISLS